MHKKYLILALALVMLISMLVPTVLAAGSGTNPPSNGYGTLIIDEGQGAFPMTLDPANEYDTASGELIFNCMETMVFFSGERYDQCTPLLAQQAWVGPPSTTPDQDTGRAAPSYTNFTVYFQIRTGIPFSTTCRTDSPASWSQYYLTTEDVKYSFQRFLVKDFIGAATWMFYEFTLDCHTGNPSDPLWQQKIADAIQCNSTHVWINCANPGLTPGTATPWTPIPMFSGVDNPPTVNATYRSTFYTDTAGLKIDYPLKILFQVFSQSWLAVYPKQWVLDYVIPNTSTLSNGMPGEWNGNFPADQPTYWANYTRWAPDRSPFDKLPAGAATPGVMCGTGPYVLDRYNSAAGWSIVRNPNYWGGWPAGYKSNAIDSPPYPPITSSGVHPAGWVDRYTVVNTRSTSGRVSDLQTGASDLSAIPRTQAPKLHAGNNRNNMTLAGIRLEYPVPTMQVEGEYYTFYVVPTPGNTFGKIFDNDTYDPSGIPANFFANPHVRKAFTYLWNFTYNIQTLFYGEAYQPFTCAPNGIGYVNPANPMYGPDPNEAAAAAEIAQVVNGHNDNLSQIGFTIANCYYDSPGGVREASVLDFTAMINKLGTDYFGGKFHAYTINIPWADFLVDMDAAVLPTSRLGWLADYADIHDWVFPFLDSAGTYPHGQRYVNSTIDGLIAEAARLPDGPARQAVYYQVELMGYQENPSIDILVPIGRGYTREWVQGMGVQRDPIYPGIYAYYMWKWLYLRGNVNFDDKISMDDVMLILGAFGSYAAKFVTVGGSRELYPSFHERWNFFCDIDGNGAPPPNSGDSSPPGDGGWRDRMIDMYDIIATLANFGKSDTPWVSLTPAQHDLAAGESFSVPLTFMYVYYPLFYGNESAHAPPYTVTYYAKNVGLSTETNVVVSLYIDKVQVSTNTVASLAPGATSSLFTYSWTPAELNPDEEGYYNVTAGVTPVAGEPVYNNKDERWLTFPYQNDMDVVDETVFAPPSTAPVSTGTLIWHGLANIGMETGTATENLYLNGTLVGSVTATLDWEGAQSGAYLFTPSLVGFSVGDDAHFTTSCTYAGDSFTANNLAEVDISIVA
jgi:peptide/nickel transport system substrate-binding protein